MCINNRLFVFCYCFIQAMEHAGNHCEVGPGEEGAQELSDVKAMAIFATMNAHQQHEWFNKLPRTTRKELVTSASSKVFLKEIAAEQEAREDAEEATLLPNQVSMATMRRIVEQSKVALTPEETKELQDLARIKAWAAADECVRFIASSTQHVGNWWRRPLQQAKALVTNHTTTGVADAHRIILEVHQNIPEAETDAKKAFREAEVLFRNVVVWQVRANCNNLKDRECFQQQAAQAYSMDTLPTDLHAQINLAYSKLITYAGEAGWVSNNMTKTDFDGRRRLRRRKRKSKTPATASDAELMHGPASSSSRETMNTQFVTQRNDLRRINYQQVTLQKPTSGPQALCPELDHCRSCEIKSDAHKSFVGQKIVAL